MFAQLGFRLCLLWNPVLVGAAMFSEEPPILFCSDFVSERTFDEVCDAGTFCLPDVFAVLRLFVLPVGL